MVRWAQTASPVLAASAALFTLFVTSACNTTLGIGEREFDPTLDLSDTSSIGDDSGIDGHVDDATDSATPADTSNPSDTSISPDTARDPDTSLPPPDTAPPPLDTTVPIDTAPPPPDTSPLDTGMDTGPATRIVFVTSTTTNGAFGAIGGAHAAADARCNFFAAGAKLPGTYKAWLSTSTMDATTYLAHFSGQYVLVDGITVVANDWTQLTSGTLLHPINMTESGGLPPVTFTDCLTGTAVWTGTETNGGVSGTATCADWTSSAPSGVQATWGDAKGTGPNWTRNCTKPRCAESAALYCIQQ
jgi:hypothetical protein